MEFKDVPKQNQTDMKTPKTISIDILFIPYFELEQNKVPQIKFNI